MKDSLKHSSKIVLMLLILAALPAGYFIIEKKLTAGRTPSSAHDTLVLPSDNDLSEATAEEFTKASKYQLLKDAEILETSVGPGISMGFFYLKNKHGEKVSVCDQYPTVDLIFAAEGIAFSGEIPKMIVRGPCLATSDLRHLEAFPVPFDKVLQSPLDTWQLDSEIPATEVKTKIFFRGVLEFWPTEWTWVGATLYDRDKEKDIVINGYEVISVLGKPVTIKPVR